MLNGALLKFVRRQLFRIVARLKLRLGQRLLIELEPFARAFRMKLFWTTLLLSTSLLMGAYQFGFSKTFDLNSSSDKPYLFGYYPVERFENFVYRWTRPTSHIVLPGVGQLAQIKIWLNLNTRPAGVAPSPVRLAANSDVIASFPSPSLEELHKIYYFAYNFEHRSLFSSNNSQLELELSTNTLQEVGDPRRLGIAVSGITVDAPGLLQTGRLTLPDWNGMALALGALVILFVLGLRLGWSGRVSALAILGVALLIAVGLALDRPTTALTLPLLLEATLISYPLVLVALAWTGSFLKKKGLTFNFRSGRWLGAIFILAFLLRVIYLNHPSFQTLDHGFRIHEVEAIRNDPLLLISRYYNMNTFMPVGGIKDRSIVAGQWNLQLALPYSPLFYIVDLPLAILTRSDDASLLYWTNILASWLDVAALFFIYIIACQTLGRYGEGAGLIGAFLFCFFPLSYLMVSDGGYNTIVANWLMLLWLTVFTGWFIPPVKGHPHPPPLVEGEILEETLTSFNQAVIVITSPKFPALSRKRIWSAGVLLALALLAHTATLLLVSALILCYLALLSLIGTGSCRRILRPTALMYAIGLSLSFVLYYGFYTVALIGNTLPTIISKIRQGAVIGDNRLTRQGFWITLVAHFHLFPFLVSSGVIISMVFTRYFGPFHRGLAQDQNFELTGKKIEKRSLLLYLAWLITFLLFSLVNTRINLLQKPMLFGLPLFALGTGLALAMLLTYLKGRAQSAKLWHPRLFLQAGELVVLGVVIWFLVAGSYTWYIRAIYYILPFGTG